ncbi:hypothetical protein [Paenibacillus chitinolyticus]|uniref:hypothetical protein n=1 Tax=Paenibacillus chitinolyticus TaxID=79263 RepID=UPI003671300C
MAISVCDFLGTEKEKFDSTGAFDAILDVDSKMFIDPHLLSACEAPEFQNSYEKVKQRFTDILKILRHSKEKGDVFWRRAETYFIFPEVKGLCIGYSNSGTSGSAIGPGLREKLLETAKSIIDSGVEEPEIFELVGLFESNIGPDRLSDITANIISEDILNYSQRIFSELNVETTEQLIKGINYKLVMNPHNKTSILLLPKTILRDLPLAFSWSDIDIVCSHNAELRHRVNQLIGDTWKQAVSQKKQFLKELIIKEPGLLEDLIALYKGKPQRTYDYINDPAGQVIWYYASKETAQKFPLELKKEKIENPDDLMDFVLTICEKYKDLIENNGLNSLLYDGVKSKKEEAAQKLFFGIADAYCSAHNIDISREVNGGRGPVDFKFSTGYKNRVVVESKLTTNGQLLHGFTTQIAEYQKAEKTLNGIYLVLDNGGPVKRSTDLKNLILQYEREGKRMPTVFFIDARPKLSASRYEPDEA